MTDQDDEFDRLLREGRTLTPAQRDALVRHAIERAKAYRAREIRSLVRWLVDWVSRRTAIAKLRSLDDRMLKDIGLHRSEIEAAVSGRERPIFLAGRDE